MGANLNVWQLVLDLIWLSFLLVLLCYFWRDRKVLAESKNWIKTKGRVTECEWTKDGHSIWPEIEYIYEANGEEYKGSYLFLDTAHNNPNSSYARQVAYKAAMSFEKKQEITVYYDPFYPQRSALDIKIPKKLNFVLFFLSLLIFIHLILMIYKVF